MALLTNVPTFSGYSVDSLDRAEEFYGKTLGLAVERTKQGLVLKTGNNPIFLYEKPNHVAATFTVLNFNVEDIDVAVDELTNAGITFEQYPELHTDEKGIGRGKAAGMGPDVAWFKDSAGNILSVLCD